jgi:hypothetical protein
MRRFSSAALAPQTQQSLAPLLVDIRTAAQTLGISVFAVRNLCWHRETARVLKPIRHGLKFLFSPAALTEFTQKLVSGEMHFPPTPVKTKSRKTAQRIGMGGQQR